MRARGLAVALALTTGAAPADADFRRAGMRRALHELGDSTPQRMEAALDAALELEDEIPGMDAPLILAIAWAESRLDPSARPLCGVMQVSPRDMGEPRSSCRKWRSDVRAGMEAGVREVHKILDEIPGVRGSLPRALEYRACGGRAFTRRCRKRQWLRRVQVIAERLRRAPFRIEESRAGPAAAPGTAASTPRM